MPVKTIEVKYEGHSIEVVNTWTKGCTLFVNGVQIDYSDKLFDMKGQKPLLSTSINVDGDDKVVEVFAKAIFTVKIKICIDGNYIGGDQF